MEEMKLTEREDHLPVCSHSPALCPEDCCTWQGKLDDLMEHLKVHNARVLEPKDLAKIGSGILLKPGLYFRTTKFRDKYQLIAWMWLNIVFVLQRTVLRNGAVLRFCLRAMAAPTKDPAQRFDYELKLTHHATDISSLQTGTIVAMHRLPNAVEAASDRGCCYVALEDACRFALRAKPDDADEELWPELTVHLQ